MGTVAGAEQGKLDGQAAELAHRQEITGKSRCFLPTPESVDQHFMMEPFLRRQALDNDSRQLFERFTIEFLLTGAMLGADTDVLPVVVAVIADAGRAQAQRTRTA